MNVKLIPALSACAAALLLATLPLLATPSQSPEPAEAPSPEACGGDARIDLLGSEVVPMTPALEPDGRAELPGTLPPAADMDICDWQYRSVSAGCCSGYRTKVKKQRRWCCQMTGCGSWQTYDTYCSNISC